MSTETLIGEIVDQIKKVDGVRAVVLGGSRARGTHTPSSDIDLGIYYSPERPLDLEALNRAATLLDDGHRPNILTPIGGWGPWINGGGWLTVQSVPVDFLYRDLGRVATIIGNCQAGRIETYYQPGHPLGFHSSIYMAELALCQPLWAADDIVATMKQRTQAYPPALKKAILQSSNWEADFALQTGKKSISRADVTYAAGSCFRSAACLLQVLFALNETYWLNEKGAVLIAEGFALRPPRLKERLDETFGLLAADGDSIQQAIDVLTGLVQETAELVANNATVAHAD